MGLVTLVASKLEMFRRKAQKPWKTKRTTFILGVLDDQKETQRNQYL